MAEETQVTIRERFLQAYANLPLQTRKEIIIVLEERPFTWDAAFFEVRNNTDAGNKILRKLEEMKIF